MDSICVDMPAWAIPTKYDIRRTCGHIETVKVMGKPAAREKQIKRLETVPCMDCRIADIVAKHDEIDDYFAAIAPDVANRIGEEYRRFRCEPLGDVPQSITAIERGIDIKYRLYQMAKSLCSAESLHEMAQVFLFRGEVGFWRSAFHGFPFQTIHGDAKTLENAFWARCKRYDTLSPAERLFYRTKQ